MARNNITVNVLANTRNLTRGIRDAAQQTSTGLRGIATSARTHVSSALTSLRELAGPAALGAGAAIGTVLIAGLAQAMEQGKITARLEAQLGATPAVAKKVGKAAGQLYSDAISTDFQQAADGIRAVMTAGLVPPDASIKQIKSISANAIDLANTFEIDLGQATNAAGQMIKTGLAKNGKEAFDILTKGFQTMGPRADDLGDTFNEYSTQFRQMGLTGAEATGILSQGMKAGARDTDVVADSLKEFTLIAQGGGEKVDAAFATIGLNGKEMQKTFVEGGPKAKAALDKVFDGLRAIKDPAERNATALALFGTKSEDMQKALLAIDPSKAVSDLGKVGGAADDMGNKLRDNAATKVEQFKRKLQQSLVDFVGTEVLPILEKVVTWVRSNQDWLKPLAGAAVALGVALGIVAAATWAWNAALAANPVVLVIAAIGLLIAAFVYAYNQSETFRAGVQKVWEWLKQTTAPVFTSIKEAISAALTAIVAFWQQHGAVITEYVTTYFGYVKGIVEGAMQYIRGIIQIVTGLISGDWGKVWEGIKNVFQGIWKVISNYVNLVWLQIQGYFYAYLAVIKKLWTEVWNALKSIVTSLWNGIKSLISGAINGIKNDISNKLNTIKSLWNGAWNAVKSFLSSAWSGIKGIVGDAVNNLVGKVKGIKGSVLGALSGAGSWLYNAGRQVIQGLINGIRSMVGAAVSAAKGVVKGAIDGAKNLLGINSPSRVFKEIGQFTVEGLALGLEKTQAVKKATVELGKTVTDNFGARINLEPVTGLSAASTGSPVSITINAGVGSDPVAIGREVRKALDAYDRANGVRR
ncbi:phage tail tape measure protein [Streptomyces sp. NPDC060223]|uniref:phage tail tape measure protein n=1 Tax=unclassified Streptomyces TaxID=2593676 RepID=UPI00363ABFD1